MAKAPFELPDDQCERLTRTEMHSVQWLLNAVSTLRYAETDLANRLACVPSGNQRLRLAIGQLGSLLKDVLGTVSDRQRRQIRNTANDMEVRLVPKLTSQKVNVVLDGEIARELVDAAQAKCHWECVPELDGNRSCELCKILEAVVPLEDYSSVSCPYWRAEWEDK